MAPRREMLALALLALFVLSGFAGLIYQTIWSHYLGLTLGHAAYAQTLVLTIFMGGMALGAAIASRYTPRMRHLVLAYAVIELLIGFAGLVFHPVFLEYTRLSQDVVLPAMSGKGATAYQWISAMALILPQCILLGMTFPLLSAGGLRLAPDNDGKVLGGLYFSNSIGAALGALVATFLLLPMLGMPGTVFTAGTLNILVAVAAALFWRVLPEEAQRPVDDATAIPHLQGNALKAAPGDHRLLPLILAATFLSGGFSFIYEIGWIRLLNQALGTTIHSFELMLAAFILGLAFGGLWVWQRSHRIVDPIAIVAGAQLWMGVSALLSIVVFANSFEWVGWMLETFQRNERGYGLFMLGSAAISLLVMFPAAFFAGMTLPLFTMALLRRGHGETSIGRVYAANTLGAIAGVALMVHGLMPLMGVHLSITLAAIGDILVGAGLLYVTSGQRRIPWTRARLAGGVAAAAAIVLSLTLGGADPDRQAAGVYRTGKERVSDQSKVVFYNDGKTATIAVYGSGGYGTIATNGKPDASLAVSLTDKPTDDEITMLMAGSLPLALHPAPENIAVIGWGSGLTTHTLLGAPQVKRVDSIEIERQMWVGAKQFGDRVTRAYNDSRSHVVFEDARTWFATGSRKYDVIVSEPSNPWVSGVASLFTNEFYGFLGKHLNEGGLLIQWMQVYELGDPLLAQMVAALTAEFPHVRTYTTNMGDLLFVASLSPIGEMDMRRIAEPTLHEELSRVGLSAAQDYHLRYLGDQDMLQTFAFMMNAKGHSDFYPTVSLQAPRDRFSRRSAELLGDVFNSPIPVMQVLGDKPEIPLRLPLSSDINSDVTRHAIALQISEALRSGRADLAESFDAQAILAIALNRSSQQSHKVWSEAVAKLATLSLTALAPEDMQGVWVDATWPGDHADDFKRSVLSSYGAMAMRDTRLAAERARGILEQHAQSLAPQMREQLLVFGLLDAARRGDFQMARHWEDTYATGEQTGKRLTAVRSYLLAWADRSRGAEVGTGTSEVTSR